MLDKSSEFSVRDRGGFTCIECFGVGVVKEDPNVVLVIKGQVEYAADDGGVTDAVGECGADRSGCRGEV